MITRSSLALIGAIFLAHEANADVLPFIRRDKVNVNVCLDNLTDYPQFDFYLKCSRNIHIESRFHDLHQVTSGKPTRLFSWGGLGTVLLVAVPRGQEIPPPSEIPRQRDWLTERLPNSLQSENLPGSAGFLSKEDDGGEFTYRVNVNDEILTVDLIEARLPPTRWGDWVALGLILMGLCVGLRIGGGFLIRRFRQSTPRL